MARAVHTVISGRVQGVWYRGWTGRQAEELGLAGWVRNRTDGTVEAVFAGADAAVEEMLRRCHDGPPAARVTEVKTAPADDPGLDSFETRPTA